MSLETLADYPLTTIYHKRPIVDTNENNVLIFIPGNPGLVEYYITYLNILQESNPTFDIYCISHAGFQTTGNYLKEGSSKYPIYNLGFQVEHKCNIIDDIVSQKEGLVNLYVLAHSVGAYITQRVVKSLEHDTRIEIKFIGLICPTVINIKESSSGQQLVFLLKYLPVIPLALLFSWVISFLPDALVRSIFQNFIFSKPKVAAEESEQAFQHSITASQKLIRSRRIIKQALTMAYEEMDTILNDDELNTWFFEDLSKKGVKIWTYFAYADHWVHDNTRSYILSRFHDLKNTNLLFEIGSVDDGITHSFCVDQSVEFAKITTDVFDTFM